MSDKIVVSIDLETTGLIPGYHEIIDISCTAIDLDTWKNITNFHTTIKPMHPTRISQEALKVNDFRIEELKEFDHPTKARGNFSLWWECGLNCKKIIPLGHGMGSFDKPFLRFWLGESLYEKMFHYSGKDTKMSAEFLRDAGILPKNLKTSLVSLSEYFNLPHKPHKSYSDSMCAILLYRRLITLVKEK